MKKIHLKKLGKVGAVSLLLTATLALSGCSGNVGVGLSVGVPIGNHGYISVGSGRNWF